MELSVNNVTHQYTNGFIAVKDISIHAETGMLGLLGPNGAGKSTIMKILSTLIRPTHGQITFNGVDILKNSKELRIQLGYLPQDFGVLPNISAFKLLEYIALLKGLPESAQRKIKIAEVLELTNLSSDAHRTVSTFSGGMKQRFGIAQMLLNDPKLIIVDEPTSGLDPGERKRFLAILRNLANSAIVIFSTHIVEDLENLCKALVIMEKGQILLSDKTDNALNSLRGKIRTTRSTESSPLFTDNRKILSSQQNYDDSFTIRYFTEDPASDIHEAAEPKLEDLYFLTIPDLTRSHESINPVSEQAQH